MNNNSKRFKATVLIMAGCFFANAVFAQENPKYRTSAAEKKQIEDYFLGVLNGDIVVEKNSKQFEEKEVEVQEVVEELQPEIMKKDLQEIQASKVETKSSEQYIALLKELNIELKEIQLEKKRVLKKLEDESEVLRKSKFREIDNNLSQGFTEKDSEFLQRKKSQKESASQELTEKLDQVKKKTTLEYDTIINNKFTTIESLKKELSQISFVEQCSVQVGDFFKECTPQYFVVTISCNKLNLNNWKGKLEIEKTGAEQRALFIQNNKQSFSSRAIYRVDITDDDYKLIVIAVELIDESGKLIKRFEDFDCKPSDEKKEVNHFSGKKKQKTVVGNELSVSGKMVMHDNSMFTNVEFLPLCITRNNYSFKIGGDICFAIQDYELSAYLKNGLDFKRVGIGIASGVIFRDGLKDLSYVLAGEFDLHISKAFGLSFSYAPCEFTFENKKINCEAKHVIKVGTTFSARY